MESVLKRLVIFISLFIFAGCSAISPVKEDKELESLVLALIKNKAEMEKKRAERRGKGIKTLMVEKSGEDFAISADLENASVSEVVQRVFKESGQSYLFDQIRLHGTMTARFDKLPLLEALNLILKPILLIAERTDDIVVIKSDADKNQPPDAKVHAEIALANLDLKMAARLLDGLYPKDIMGTNTREVEFGPVSASNTMYLGGRKDAVSKAAQLLMKADSEVRHIAIEVLVVEYSSGALEELGAKLNELKDGKYGGTLDYGSATVNDPSKDIISFSKTPFDPTTFTAAINFLMSDNKARLISRPYISTLSGKEAEINISSDRYVIVDEGEGATSTQSITAGVILKITPIVMADGRLRMEVSVEDSQFSAVNVSNVSTEVRKNSAKTVMQVEDGQTIIVGGLVLNRTAWSNTGFPFLRRIPILNLLFADRGRELEEKEVSIYVTPHIWKPNMLSPIIAPDALTIKDGKDIGTFIDSLK
ncbi:type II and III secretion system protein [Desulfobacterales bacterium HSG2]|nr:type II and III secretion system protein [Desulfobacterales bacterium HSG2]